MIKNFEEYINEDYFSKLANRKDTGNVRKENEITEDFVRSFILGGCEEHVRSINIRKDGNETIVDIVGNFNLSTHVNAIPFQFGEVDGNFDCSYTGITSLKGCPQEVSGCFSCYDCKKITSLEGCPKEVGGHFNCRHCGKKFTKEEVESLCEVKGKIFI